MSRSAPTTDPATSPSAEQPQPPGEGRDARGRFTAGNKYGPGNPFARQTAQLRQTLLEVVTPEELRQVAFALLLRAKAGNLTATRLLFQYVLGKPAEAVDPDRLDVEEWKLSQEAKVNPVAVKETVDHMPVETANVLVRHVWPASTETNYLSVAREELQAMDREDAERARAAQEKPAEANGDDGRPPHPQPLSHEGRGEQEARGGGAAREGGSAKPQAAAVPPAEANGGNGPAPGAPDGGRAVKSQAARRRTEANGSNGGRAAAGAPSINGGDGGVQRRSPPPGRPR